MQEERNVVCVCVFEMGDGARVLRGGIQLDLRTFWRDWAGLRSWTNNSRPTKQHQQCSQSKNSKHGRIVIPNACKCHRATRRRRRKMHPGANARKKRGFECWDLFRFHIGVIYKMINLFKKYPLRFYLSHCLNIDFLIETYVVFRGQRKLC